MYLDSAYLVKFYANEPDSAAVRELIRRADSLVSSALALGEVSCALHRHLREGHLTAEQVHELVRAFLEHVDAGIWTLIPVSERLLRRSALLIGAAPPAVYLRAGDAIHLVTAQDAGEREIWTSDRHLLAAAPYFGLLGRST
jgi:predicted nucleic acid-binding protein